MNADQVISLVSQADGLISSAERFQSDAATFQDSLSQLSRYTTGLEQTADETLISAVSNSLLAADVEQQPSRTDLGVAHILPSTNRVAALKLLIAQRQRELAYIKAQQEDLRAAIKQQDDFMRVLQ